MSSNVKERLDNIQELDDMLDAITNQNKEEIISNKVEFVDITKHSDLHFTIGEKEFSQDVYEVVTEKDGEMWHEFYDKNSNLIAKISDEQYTKGKVLSELGEASFDDNSLMDNIYERDGHDKTLSQLENEQNEEIAATLGMNPKDIKELNIIRFSENTSVSEQTEEARRQLEMYKTMGFPIDTSELATSEQTIKEFLNIDADNLLVIKVNSEWKALRIDNGKIELEDNLQIVDNSQSFSTINQNNNKETIEPNVEFRRKDNPDYSLAIVTNKEERAQAYIVTGNSRTGSEIETKSLKSPYADTKNNELLQEASENPNKEIIEDENDIDEKRDIHEPDELTLQPRNYNH